MAKVFSLPKSWYFDTVSSLVDGKLTRKFGDLTDSNAWAFVYAIVLWSEKHGTRRYLHTNDKLSTAAGRKSAEKVQELIESELNFSATQLNQVIDQIGKEYAALRRLGAFSIPKKRDPNTTGTAFETTLQVLIGRLTGHLPLRTPPLHSLRGFELAPTGYHSRPDLAMFSTDDFRMLISTKWTLRKERLGTYLHEAYFYKRRRPDLQVAFVVNEFNPSILQWLVNDPLVDRVYHVNSELLLRSLWSDSLADESRTLAASAGGLGWGEADALGRWLDLRRKVKDLSELFDDVRLLQPVSGPVGPVPSD